MKQLRIVTLYSLCLLAACAREPGPDYCKKHAAFHPDHAGRVGHLSIKYDEQGELGVSLEVPLSTPGMKPEAALLSALTDIESVVTIGTRQPCAARPGQISTAAGRLTARYQVSCGSSNKLNSVDIAVFDVLQGVEELEVNIDTDAAGKHFLINRQCDSALFNFKPEQ